MSTCLTHLINWLFSYQPLQPKIDMLIIQLDPSKFHRLFVSKASRLNSNIILNELFIIELYVSYQPIDKWVVFEYVFLT